MKLTVHVELKIKSLYLTAERDLIAQYKYFTFKIDLFFREISFFELRNYWNFKL